MRLEGVVTNVVAFGAFVDIGVHQDGLVHVSQLADRYVQDPNKVVHVGQKVTVTVTAVDLPRNRIALTMKTQGEVVAAPKSAPAPRPAPKKSAFVPRSGAVAPNGMRFK
jgi:uncharacterized protein